MFGVDSSELLLIVLIAVVVIGPKDLPRVMRTVGQWVGRARGMANQFRLGVDQMVRDSEVADLEKKWREQNEAIMRAHPFASPPPPGPPPPSDWGLSRAADATPVSLEKPVSEAATPAPPMPPSDQPQLGAPAVQPGRRAPRTAPESHRP